jgi:hypothetical protein
MCSADQRAAVRTSQTDLEALLNNPNWEGRESKTFNWPAMACIGMSPLQNSIC